MVREPPPHASSVPPKGKPAVIRVLIANPTLLCILCGRVMHIDLIPGGPPPRDVVASCYGGGCKLQHVRLKVPLRTIECELL